MNHIKINYATSAVVIPGKAIDVMDRASMTDIKVLLCLCAKPQLTSEHDESALISRLSELTDGDESSVGAALAFWRGAGVLTVSHQSGSQSKKKKLESPTEKTEPEVSSVVASEATKEEPAPKPSLDKHKPRPKDELPHYTTEQLANLLEKHTETASWINECQRVFGKMFNTHEVNVVLGLVDYLGLEWEYVLCLLAYYVEMREKRGLNRSIKGVADLAYDLYDRGIETLGALHEEIQRLELFYETEGKLRTLFGMGARTLTPTEKKYFSTWLYEYQYGMDIIRMAYDVTVDATGKANIKYMNSVLGNWHKDGLRTPEAVRAADEAFKAAAGGRKKQESTQAGSFDTDDFFAAAVRRSFGEDAKEG